MYIPNDDTQNYPLCKSKLGVKTFEQSTIWSNQSRFTKVPKVVKPRMGKRYYKTNVISPYLYVENVTLKMFLIVSKVLVLFHDFTI